MTLGNIHTSVHRFRPNSRIPGGSDKGKPHYYWPKIFVMVGDFIIELMKGSTDAANVNSSSCMSVDEFIELLEIRLPGAAAWIEADRKKHKAVSKTHWAKLLMNRVYKGHYTGTSALRGKKHDPKTRYNGKISPEHWKQNVPDDHKLMQLYRDLQSGAVVIVYNWKTMTAWRTRYRTDPSKSSGSLIKE